MRKKVKDTDYAFISALIRARETRLPTIAHMERMLEAKSIEEAARVPEECGFSGLAGLSSEGIEERLSGRWSELLSELSSLVPDPNMVNIFRLKYDYHNAKVLIKAGAVRTDGERLLSGDGIVPAALLSEAYFQSDYRDIPEILGGAMAEARDVISRTGNPQLSDFILDRAYFGEFLKMANETGSGFLINYVKLAIDTVNLRSVVRAMRMDKDDRDFLKQVLLPGGAINPDNIINAAINREDMSSIYKNSSLKQAAGTGFEIVSGGRLTEFERLCDNTLSDYIKTGRNVSFGEEPLIAYIYTYDMAISGIRIIMTGLMADIEPGLIRERLREL